jgi:hypothetical protein
MEDSPRCQAHVQQQPVQSLHDALVAPRHVVRWAEGHDEHLDTCNAANQNE